MIGMTMRDRRSRITGVIDAVAVHGDGKALVRIRDHWFMVDGLVAV